MQQKNTRKQHSFFQGALILTIAALIVKIIGAVFKIPLNYILGGDGMGFFSTAYDLYMPIYVLSNAGLPVAIARVVAKSAAQGNFRDVRKTLKLANLIFFITGTVGFCIMFFGARFFVNTIGNPGAYLAVTAMAPTVFFVCLTSSFRGYYEGLQNMFPTALSQVVEVIAKLVVGFGLSAWLYNYGMTSYETTSTVFGVHYNNLEAAKIAVLQVAAAGAIAGVACGSLFSALSIFLRHKIKGDQITKEELEQPQQDHSRRSIFKEIISISIPIALGSCVSQLTGVIDLWSVLNRLHSAIASDFGVIAQMYGDAIPAGKLLEDIPNYLNGCYKGMAVTLYNLIPTFTVALGVSALPPITVAWESKNHLALKTNIESVLRMTMLLALPLALGMSFLSNEILTLLFSSRPAEVTIATPLLSILAIAVIFSAACSPINSMLQAVGRADLPLKIMAVCAVIKLSVNYVLVGTPSINIRGAAIGTLICYVLIMTISLYFLFKITKIKPDLVSIFLKPAISGLGCGGGALIVCRLLQTINGFPSKLATVIAILSGGIIYVALLILLRAITEDDLSKLPKGQKLIAIYRRLPGIKK